MPREIVIKRSALVTVLLAMAGVGVLLLMQNMPEIRRELKIWMM